MYTIFVYENRCRKEKECEFDGNTDLPSIIEKIFKRHTRRTVCYYIVFSKEEKKLLKKLIVLLHGTEYENEELFFDFFQSCVERLEINELLRPCYVSAGIKDKRKYPYIPESKESIEKGKYPLAIQVYGY